jgi:hypothetical protein
MVLIRPTDGAFVRAGPLAFTIACIPPFAARRGAGTRRGAVHTECHGLAVGCRSHRPNAVGDRKEGGIHNERRGPGRWERMSRTVRRRVRIGAIDLHEMPRGRRSDRAAANSGEPPEED